MPSVRTTRNRTSATSSSNAVRTSASHRQKSGRVVSGQKTLKSTAIRVAQEEEARQHADRLQSMSRRQRRELQQLQDIPDLNFGDDDFEDDVLHGRAAAQISHEGDAFASEAQADAQLYEEIRQDHRKRYPDTRKRRNRTQFQVDGFAPQLERMADTYLEWSLEISMQDGLASTYSLPEGTRVQGTRKVVVVDIFAASREDLHFTVGDAFESCSCVRQGWIPSSPTTPTAVITIRALEIFRVARLRCPRLGVQAFVRALCDIHGVAPRAWLSTQFSVAFDIYLAVRAIVDRRVQVALGRQTPNWRLKNACPACLYRLDGEPTLKIPIMVTCDGNNSLSRTDLCEKSEVDDSGAWIGGASKARYDDRVAAGDYYISREEVNKWAKDSGGDVMKSFAAEGLEDEHDGACRERWQNMKESVTSRAYGMYDETGIFLCLCRHGFVMVVEDMVKSGELSKYALSVVAHLLKVLGKLAVGYDIGCLLDKLVKAHPELSALAEEKGFKALVGAFHGHGHNRLCGVDYLMTYVEGVGLEALEGCESFFSKSNALASTTRHASRFHRQQAITTYLKHTDTFDTYSGLVSLLSSKYRRALEVKSTYQTLREAMRDLGVRSRDEFERWREKERAHLRTLSKEPAQETLEMEYYQKLVNLREAEENASAILSAPPPPVPAEANADYAEGVKTTRRLEAQRRHALELHGRALKAVHDLEIRLAVPRRWTPEDAEWRAAATLVSHRRYQRALDNLQGLIIARMFELGKCNMSGTGYKLRKHIAKALQARSKAVKTAIERYNEAARAMQPPKPTLEWEEVVEYAFLADFDLLREGREDIRGELWAQPAGHAAMDQHYKLLRADEEIQRLDVEIRRLVTHMRDEERFLSREEGRLREEGKATLAHQVRLLRDERGRFTERHTSQLAKLASTPGFTGNITPGVSISRERHELVVRDGDADMPPPPAPPPEFETPPNGNDDDGDDDSEDEDSALAEVFLNIVRISQDSGTGSAENNG
ncbi:hypothetical protein R3P38DRAFT_2513560 [Favolaschia claudopus]|uniref:CxC1-like cysteine cluster associated with KDZ transposases domain-containing protein n=1 Tax=Favolaschia claudopus TaxID=2862362 RepID=A0AAW0CQ04_9AGAR